MFNKKTVDSVLSQLNTMQDDLQYVFDQQKAEADRQDKLKSEAEVKMYEAEKEAERASRVREKISELIS